ncbi:MAG: alanine racemase [Ruthenibacterium sp.]
MPAPRVARPILILVGQTLPAPLLAVNTITRPRLAARKALSYAALHAASRCVHLKVDTGMGRVGFAARDDMERAVAELEEACHLPNLSPTGIFTHFAVADSDSEADEAYTAAQHECFFEVVQRLAARGCRFACVHCCNSAGTFLHPEYHHDMVRAALFYMASSPRCKRSCRACAAPCS